MTRVRSLLVVAAVVLSGVSLVATSAAPANASSQPWAKRLWGYLQTRDGAQLRYSVLLPSAHGRFPVVLNYSGYDAGSIGGSSYQDGDTWMETELDAKLLKAGYAVMGLQLRGTGCSSGTFQLFDRRWGTDGAQAVEWAAEQPWSTGHVGMFLWSWPGITQLFVAAQRPPHLDAIAPGMVVTDALRDVGAPGGLGNLSFPTLWWVTIQDAWTYAASSAPAEGDSKCLTNLAVNLANGQLRSPTTLSTHLFWDRFWADRDLLAMTKRIKVPVLSMVDWQDEEVGARAGYYWRNLNPRKTWVVGTNGQHDIYLSNAFARTLRAFFDHFLKGRSNGFAQTPHVRLWQDTTAPGGPQSSDEQLAHAKPSFVVTQRRLPIRVRANRLFFTASGRLSAARPTSANSARSFVAAPGPAVNFDVPAAVTGGDGGPLGEAPWQLSTSNPGALTFTTSRLSKSVVIAGPASVDLWVTSALPVGALQATLTDVRRDGAETYLQRGWLDLTQRAIDNRRSTALAPFHPQTLATVAPMIPGRPTLVRIEIPNVSHVFPKGAAIRVTIDAPSPTGDWIFDAVPAGLDVIGTNRVQASSLILGVMRTGVRTGKLPNCARLTGTPCRPNSAPVPAGAPTALSAPRSRRTPLASGRA